MIKEEIENGNVSADESATAPALPPVSIVVVVNDNAPELKDNLPVLLEQDYDGDYQVIVVVDTGDDQTSAVLSQHKDNARLYTTFIPDSSRYMSRRKLAITLGVKAARHPWIMLTDITCRPASSRWLSLMAAHLQEPGIRMVAGYSALSPDDKSSRAYDDAKRQLHSLRRAAKGKSFSVCGQNLLFSKEMFLKGKGFDGNLQHLRGEYCFLADKFSTAGNTAAELSPDAWCIEEPLSRKAWLNKRLFHIDVRPRLHHLGCQKFLRTLSALFLHLVNIALVIALAGGALLEQWVAVGVVAGAVILWTVVIAAMCHRALSAFLPHIGALHMALLETGAVWRSLMAWIRYKMADKYDFTSHKV